MRTTRLVSVSRNDWLSCCAESYYQTMPHTRASAASSGRCQQNRPTQAPFAYSTEANTTPCTVLMLYMLQHTFTIQIRSSSTLVQAESRACRA